MWGFALKTALINSRFSRPSILLVSSFQLHYVSTNLQVMRMERVTILEASKTESESFDGRSTLTQRFFFQQRQRYINLIAVEMKLHMILIQGEHLLLCKQKVEYSIAEYIFLRY